MAARAIASGTISFGLVSVPIKLFSATQSKSLSFNLLHDKDKLGEWMETVPEAPELEVGAGK